MSTTKKPDPRKWRRFWGLALLLGFMLTVGFLFRHILIPFLLALAIVYIIEPVVGRISALGIKGRRVPRWVAVITVYLGFLGGVTLLGLIILPPLAREFASLAEEAPRFLEDVRSEHIPEWNEDLQGLVDRYFPEELSKTHVERTREDVYAAVALAESTALVIGAMTPEERQLFLLGGTALIFETEEEDEGDDAALRIRFDEESGEWLVTLGVVEVVPSEETLGGYTVRAPLTDDQPATTGFDFDLEESMNESLTGLVEVSGNLVTNLLTLGQSLVVILLSAFVGMILTMMVAAFISIDLPGILAYFRSLVPESSRVSYDDLLHKLDRGLAGVVRGQVLICLVNGTLTGVGLLLFNVKFALIIALVAGVLSLIPIFGTIISTIPAVAMALTQGVSVALLVLGWILLIHFIEANILNPKIIGVSAHIHPVIVVFALLAGEHSFGLIGALLAVPVASIILTLLRFVLERLVADQKPPEEAVT